MRVGRGLRWRRGAGALALAAVLVGGTAAQAEGPPRAPDETPAGDSHGPGRGKTAELEVRFLERIIDHHFSALRMTELAAGTDEHRRTDIKDTEGTAPSPGFEATPPRAQSPDLKSLARRNNRMQREEILQAQSFLRRWYGREHEPQLDEMSRQDIARLEALEGKAFDAEFLRTFSRHHFMATMEGLECLAGRELEHSMLDTYCRNVVQAQINDIQEMRHMLCEEHGDCDFQPQEEEAMTAGRTTVRARSR